MTHLAVHGHFYQPPRDDPATGVVPREAGAAPYGDWNAKITAQCYRPNAELGNFSGISFDLGPTLARWLQAEAPAVHRAIVAADGESLRDRGAGNALAQAYHHTILPLASRRDKEIQTAWGIADFAHRFGRGPRGMWLPETAADAETLEVLAARGIAYTVLAPWQVRLPEGADAGPWWIELGGGRRIAAFVFHRRLSARLSFDGGATEDADAFARAVAAEAGSARGDAGDGRDRLVLVASDGELYGHHRKFRDLFLARLLGGAATAAGLTLTSLERYLDATPPRGSAQLVEPGAWSCHHGVDRWRRECACTPGAAWKAPFRRAFDALAAAFDEAWEGAGGELVGSPWRLLERSVEPVLGRRSLADLAAEEAGRTLRGDELEQLGRLLDAAWMRQRMFASCAWFWDDLDRIEPLNALAAAAVAVEGLRRATGADLAPAFRRDLAAAASPRSGRRADRLFNPRLGRARKVPEGRFAGAWIGR